MTHIRFPSVSLSLIKGYRNDDRTLTHEQNFIRLSSLLK